jgi:hypothetical protein
MKNLVIIPKSFAVAGNDGGHSYLEILELSSYVDIIGL